MDDNKLAELIFPKLEGTIAELEAGFPERDLKKGAYVTRFAPSPTGYMHIGGLYAAMISARLAEQTDGVFYLRIEDTDKKRELEAVWKKSFSRWPVITSCLTRDLFQAGRRIMGHINKVSAKKYIRSVSKSWYAKDMLTLVFARQKSWMRSAGNRKKKKTTSVIMETMQHAGI